MNILTLHVSVLLCLLLVVFTFAQPGNDECGFADTLSGLPPVSGTNVGASDDTEPNGCTPSGFNSGVWYTFNSGTNTRATLSTCSPNTDFDTVIGLYSGACGSLACVDSNDDSICMLQRAELLDVVISEFSQYYVVVGGKTSADTGTFDLALTLSSPPPVNDECGSAVTLSGGPVADTNAFATDDTEPNGCSPSGFNKGIWYTFNSGINTRVTLSLCIGGATFDSVIGLYSGSCGSLTCVTSNDDGPCGTASELSNVVITPTTQYHVVVGGKTSLDAGDFVLTFTLSNPPPGNNQCASASTIVSGSPVSGTNLGATNDPGAGCTPSGFNKGVWYTFNSGTNTRATLSLCVGATFDSVIGLYSGSCGSLTCVTSNDDGPCGTASELSNVVITPGTQYRVVVGGKTAANFGSFTLSLQLFNPPPVNDGCGTAITISEGTPASDTNAFATDDTEPNGCSPSGFNKGIWYTFTSVSDTRVSLSLCGSSFDSVIGLYSGSCGSLTCVTSNDDGSCGTASELTNVVITPGTQYRVVVGGKTASDFGSFTLSMNLFTPPANDQCGSAITISEGTPASGTNVDATDDTEPNGCSPSGLNKGIWYTFTSVSDTRVSLSLCGGTNFDSVIGLYSGSCGSLTCVASNDNGFGLCGTASELTNVMITTGTPYFVVVGGNAGATGTFELTIDLFTPPGNDQCSGADELFDGVTQSSSNVNAFDDSSNISNLCGISGETQHNVWYTFTATNQGTLRISTCNTASFDTIIGIYQGVCGSLSCLGSNNNGVGCSEGSDLSVNVPAAGVYYALISGFGGATGNFQIVATFTASGVGGDPHVVDLSGQKFDIPALFDGKILSIYHDLSLRIHGLFQKKTAMFLTAIGASFVNPFTEEGLFKLEAKLIDDLPRFYFNDQELSVSEFDFPAWLSLSLPQHQQGSGVISELGRYHTVELHVSSMFTIVGGDHPVYGGFFNIQVFRDNRHSLEFSRGLLQTGSAQGLEQFIRERLLE